MGKHKLSKDFNVSLEEADGMLENYFKGFPELKKAIDNTHKQATEELRVTTMFGRCRHFQRNQWNKLDDKALRQSFNFLIQSAGADIIRLASINVYNLSLEYPEWNLKLIGTIHDELIMEIDEKYLDVSLPKINEAFVSVKELVSPLKCGIGYGASYGDAK
jgi:DNA polymerase-1